MERYLQDERLLFLSGLSVLFLSGCVILAINTFTDSRKAQISGSLSQSLWGFSPDVPSDVVLRRQRWAYRKLVASGVMLSSLFLSSTVRALKPRLSCAISAAIFVLWVSGVTMFWYFNVVPKAQSSRAADRRTGDKSTAKDDDRLPVTIVTGFLGAGKTTLVKHILSNTTGMKILVIENEVGEEGVDHDLLLNYAGKEEIVLLKNGCVCCTVRSDLIKTFRAIFEKDLFRALDWVVVETTGLADPAPVIQSLLVDDMCKKHLRLDSVLTVVDIKHIRLHLPEDAAAPSAAGAASDAKTAEAALQIAFADRILLNKLDLVSPEEAQSVKELLLKINPQAHYITCANSKVNLEKILNIRSFDPKEFAASWTAEAGKRKDETELQQASYSFLPKDGTGKVNVNSSSGGKFVSRRAPDPTGSASTAVLGANHMEVVSTVSLSLPGTEPLDLESLNMWIVSLLQRDGADIYRFKGILNISGHDEKFIMHGVHMIFNGERGPKWEDEKSRHSRLVFIGKNLDFEELKRCFLSCRATVDGKGTSSQHKKVD